MSEGKITDWVNRPITEDEIAWLRKNGSAWDEKLLNERDRLRAELAEWREDPMGAYGKYLLSQRDRNATGD